MPLAEGVQGTIVYKAYASGVIAATTEDLAPGSSDGQTLRRVSSTLNLAKNTYTSAAIRSDRQIADVRHGARHVQGDIAGELSPATYFDFFEAVLQNGSFVSSSLLQQGTLSQLIPRTCG